MDNIRVFDKNTSYGPGDVVRIGAKIFMAKEPHKWPIQTELNVGQDPEEYNSDFWTEYVIKQGLQTMNTDNNEFRWFEAHRNSVRHPFMPPESIKSFSVDGAILYWRVLQTRRMITHLDENANFVKTEWSEWENIPIVSE